MQENKDCVWMTKSQDRLLPRKLFIRIKAEKIDRNQKAITLKSFTHN